MGRDPRVYRDPDNFCPERYESVEDGGFGEPLPFGHFGFGRRYFTLFTRRSRLRNTHTPWAFRICVGRFLADNSVWVMVATVLATLSFQKATDDRGNFVEPKVELSNGGTWSVLPPLFSCFLHPRVASSRLGLEH